MFHPSLCHAVRSWWRAEDEPGISVLERIEMHRISPRNIVMYFMLWLRSYPSYHLLSLLFAIRVTTVHDEINWFIPVMWEKFHAFVQWPTLAEWTEKIGNWNKRSAAVGAVF